MTLVFLPITAMSGLAVIVDSLRPTAAERVSVELGQMQSWVRPVAEPGQDVWQSPSDPDVNGLGLESYTEQGAVAERDPADVLPGGTELIPISVGSTRVETAAGIAGADVVAGDALDPRFEGRYTLVEGSRPRGNDEVAVTRALLERLDGGLGGTLTLTDTDETFTVTAIVDIAELPDSETAVVLPSADRFSGPTWYLPDTALSWDQIQGLNDEGFVVFSREVVLDPPEWTNPNAGMSGDTALFLSGLTALGVGAAFTAYVVVMLAGAAFAVSGRRQERALAIAASVGADARDLRRTVLLQGTVLGGVGGVLGAAVGIAAAAIVMPLLSDGSAAQFWGFHVPWWLLALIVVFAIAVGTGAALIPARAVTKTDALSALRGARKPQAVRASRPIIGSLMILVGIALTILCGIAAAAVAVIESIPGDSPLLWLPIIGIIVGPIVAQIGVVVSGRWLLWLFARVFSRVSVAARIATRDASANASRTVPAFAAIAATVFLGTFAVALGSMSTAHQTRNYMYTAPVGTAWVELAFNECATEHPGDAVADRAIDILQGVGADDAAVVRMQANWYDFMDWETGALDPSVAADRSLAVAVVPEQSRPTAEEGWASSGFATPENNLMIMSPDAVEQMTGSALTEQQLDAFAAGAALVTDPSYVADGAVEIAAWGISTWESGAGSDIVFRDVSEDVPDPLWSARLDALTVPALPGQGGVIISASTAEDLGLEVHPRVVFAHLGDPVSADVREELWGQAEAASTPEYSMWSGVETGPADMWWIAPVLAAVGVLVVGASAVALGLARFERRPDDATLTAVGATRSLRRRVAFWQGFIIAGFGLITGAAAGVLPALGIALQTTTQWGGPYRIGDVPWLIIAAFAVGLTVLIAAVNALIPPRTPDLTRRTVIA